MLATSKEAAIPPCLVCDGESKTVGGNRFSDYYRCDDCGLHFCGNLKVQPDLYARAYDGKVAEANMQEFFFRAQYLANLPNTDFLAPPPVKLSLKWLDRHAPASSTILDVGCGWGMMLRALHARGFRTVGSDIAPQVHDVLGRQGFQIFIGSIDLYPESFPEPDYVTCNYVLHHPSDPIAFIQSIARRFPKAPLLLSEGLYPNWMHGRLPQPCLEYPRDLTAWSSRALSIALEKGGYSRYDFLYPRVSTADVQLPLMPWLAQLAVRWAMRAARQDRAAALTLRYLANSIRVSLLVKRVAFAGHAWYARWRRLEPASVLAVAYPKDPDA